MRTIISERVMKPHAFESTCWRAKESGQLDPVRPESLPQDTPASLNTLHSTEAKLEWPDLVEPALGFTPCYAVFLGLPCWLSW